jgi:hypothetical protein
MSRRIRKGRREPLLKAILDGLAAYETDHPNAEIEVYRQNSASVRIRIIDPDFNDMNRVERDTKVWKLLKLLPEDVVSEITLLLLLTPDETATSMANMEFEHPLPSRL